VNWAGRVTASRLRRGDGITPLAGRTVRRAAVRQHVEHGWDPLSATFADSRAGMVGAGQPFGDRNEFWERHRSRRSVRGSTASALVSPVPRTVSAGDGGR
jgi:hypothetical protein